MENLRLLDPILHPKRGSDLIAAALAVLIYSLDFLIALTKNYVPEFLTLSIILGIGLLIVLIRLKDIPIIFIVITISVHLIFLLSLLLTGMFEGIFLQLYFRFAVCGGLAMLLISLVRDPKQFISCLYIISLFSVILTLRMWISESYDALAKNYMSSSYYILDLFSILLYMYMITRKKVYLPTICICFMMLLIIGTRGAIIAALLAIILGILLLFNNKYKKMILICLIILVMLAIPTFFKKESIILVGNYLEKIGIKSRTIHLLLTGSSASENIRLSIYSTIWQYIQQSPFFGYGIVGDRILLMANYYFYRYTHNLYLEVLVQFGLVFGMPLLIMLHWLLISRLRAERDRIWRMLLLILMCTWFLPLMVSGTYLTQKTLFVVGLFLNRKLILAKSHINEKASLDIHRYKDGDDYAYSPPEP